MTVSVERGELVLDGRRLPLLSGEVHFWRLDPAAWDPILRQVAALGVPIVATYLSWGRHQPTPDVLDLEGRSDARLDVRRFIELAARHGLLVHLKPGPWICAEEPAGGYPDWLLADPDLWERDARGRPVRGYAPPFSHPVPAYLHPRYLEAATNWLRAVAIHMTDLVWPAGPIVMLQLDNEPSHCFRDGPAEAGHHPLTQAVYAERGGGWADFAGWLLEEHLRRLRASLAGTAFDDLLMTVNTNEHRVPGVPADAAALARAVGGIGGEDLYYRPPLRRRDLARLALAAALAVADEPLPWAPEIQAGIWRLPGVAVRHPDPTPTEQRLWNHAALAFGLRGLNFYMLANREHWALAPIAANGERTPFLDPVETTVRIIHAYPAWGALRPLPSIALAWRRSDLNAAWAAGDTGAGPTLAAFERLVLAGHTVAIWNAEFDPRPTDLPVVDPGRPAGQEVLTALPAVGATAGAWAVLQRGGGAEALFVLNPTRRPATVRLAFSDRRRSGWMVPVADGGPSIQLTDGAAQLRLGPLGTAVYRIEAQHD